MAFEDVLQKPCQKSKPEYIILEAMNNLLYFIGMRSVIKNARI
jgi:hypothetical protein